MTEDPPRVVVTGAAGYIGSRLVADLQSVHPAWDVTGLDDFSHGEIREIDGLTVDEVDIRDRPALERALDGADVVVHLAAVSGVDDCENDPDRAYEVNVLGTEHVAWHCRRTGAAMLFPFSMAVLGDPHEFPITVEHPRDPMNWYGRTKYLGERSIETFADGAFPALQFMISNLYGAHRLGDRTVSKGTVINFFVERALAGESLTVYEPGTQARNFIHVHDVANAMRLGVERAVERRRAGDTGSVKYALGSTEDRSVHRVAELVQSAVADHSDTEPPIELVANPRDDETLVGEFAVDTTAAREELGWEPGHSVRDSIEARVVAALDD